MFYISETIDAFCLEFLSRRLTARLFYESDSVVSFNFETVSRKLVQVTV